MKRTLRRALAISSFLVLPVVASRDAQAESVFSSPPVHTTLKNGLGVVILPTRSPGVLAYYTLVRAGSRDEVEPGKSGFAHLFEHMMFRGSRNVSRDQYEKSMQALGADNNAFTTSDYTLYTVTLPKQGLAEVIRLESDRFQNLSFTDPSYKDETGAVMGEYNKGAANPDQKMWESMSEAAFGRHTYGHTTIGYLKDVQAMPQYADYARKFFQRFYTPDDCTLIVAGDVDPKAVLPTIEAAYANWTSKRDQPKVPEEPAQTSPRSKALVWPGETAKRMLLGYKIPGYAAAVADIAALEVAHALLFSDASPLYEKLVLHDKKLIELSSWSHDEHKDPSLFVVEAKLRETTSFDEVVSEVTSALEQVAKGQVDEARLGETRQHLQRALILQMQSPGAVAAAAAHYQQLTGDVAEIDHFMDALRSVKSSDVVRAVRTYLLPQRRTVVTLAPKTAAPAPRSQP